MDERDGAKRLKFWLAYIVISFVVAISAIDTTVDVASSKRRQNRNWCIGCSIITFLLTITLVLLHTMTSTKVIGGKFEGFAIFVMVAFWCSLVAVISQPGNGIAVDDVGKVEIGNLYYFSWAGVTLAFYMTISYVKDCSDIKIPHEMKLMRFKLWVALMITSVIVLAASADVFERICGDSNSVFCSRAILGVAFGCISTVFSLINVAITVAAGMAPAFKLEAVLAAIVFILSGLGVAFITGANGPGEALGNLYYCTWFSFGLSFLIGSSCYEEYYAEEIEEELQEHPQSWATNNIALGEEVDANDVDVATRSKDVESL